MKSALHLVALLCLTGSVAAAGAPERLGPEDFHAFDEKQAKIGQLLFYDKILSGNRNISCGTCHHHDHHGTDALSLGLGEGGQGVGPQRTAGTGDDRIRKRIPRNAPALWNLGHSDIRVLFHDGRLEISDLYGNGFNSPAQEWLPSGFAHILAAQAVLPLVAQFEMAGNPKENEIAGAVHDRIDAAWPILAKRVRTIPAYGAMFVEAFDNVDRPEQVSIVDIANALAAFIGREWQSYDAPFDAWLAGDASALTKQQERGRELFFGPAGCSKCHSGPLFTDQGFHALALPAFGPGRTRQWDPMPRDVGRVGESNQLEDMYRFRTPSLRNVSLTGPYGHNGAYRTLEGMLRHHLDPVSAREDWTPAMAVLPDVPWLSEIDFVIQSDRLEMARQAGKFDIQPVALSDPEIADLLSFLHALTGETAQSPRPLGRPDNVPSGLPVD
ncbi:MAG: cytochrome c peroxidase [Pseudomonadota bacterium]